MTTMLTGRQKAAVVLVQLGVDRAARVLSTMSESEVIDLMVEVAELPPLDPGTVREIVGELVRHVSIVTSVAQGGPNMARELLMARLGARQADVLMEQIAGGHTSRGPLSFLEKVYPHQAATFLEGEHAQTVAVVLAHLPAERAAPILDALSEDLRPEVARRLATMEWVSPDAVAKIASILQRRLAAPVDTGISLRPGGIDSLVAILNHADPAAERRILTGLEERDAPLAEAVRSKLFVFEDIITLEDRDVQRVLREVEAKELATALKGASTEVREKILANVSQRAAADLDEEIAALGPTKLSTVEAAQSGIVRIIRELEITGEISLERSKDEVVL